MTSEKVNDLEVVELFDYFSPEYFRIVPAEVKNDPCGITEIPVIMNLHYEFAKKLVFNQSSLQAVYGFARLEKKLAELNGSTKSRGEGEHLLKYVEINDCGDLFTMILEFRAGTKKFLALKAGQVLELLNNCRHPVEIYSETL